MPDPIHQFEIHPIVPLKIFGIDASFTNSAAFMLLAIVCCVGFLIWAMSARAMVPGRAQSMAELSHEFIANMIRDSMGEQGMKFFPLVFTLFAFVFTLNMLGMIPIPGVTFTVTAQIVVTAALALLVFVTVLIVGFAKNGMHFLHLFVPSGVPAVILPFVVLIEVISFLSRPVSHSVRLFANMLAGHITLKVFAGFIIMLLGAGGWAALAPLAGAVVVPGNLVVQSNVKAIQHPTGGVVAEIPVHNGMRVKAGDLLLRLDATQAQASLQVLTKQLDEFRARSARLIAERDGLARPDLPDELAPRIGESGVKSLLAAEAMLFQARASARESQ